MIRLGLLAALGTLALAATTHSGPVLGARCVRTSGNVLHYCGPATARLSIFPRVVFRSGSCARKLVNGVHLLQVRIGARSLDGSRTNDGLTLFSLGMSDSRAGSVVTYHKSKRWFGRTVSFRGDASGGTFVAQGIAGNRGHATGRFRCEGSRGFYRTQSWSSSRFGHCGLYW